MSGLEHLTPPGINMDTGRQLLTLLQFSDSFFPTGGFSQSYGLETCVQHGLVGGGGSFREVLTTFIDNVLGREDGPAVSLAWKAAASEDYSTLVQIDQILSATKMARESRTASVKTGCRMLRTAGPLLDAQVLWEYLKLIEAGSGSGHHAVAFGLAGCCAGLTLKQTILGYLYNAVAAMVNNGVRLIPLGQQEGQRILWDLIPLLNRVASEIPRKTLDDLGSTAPALEIRAMQHERLYTRLFMS
ncbi:MAG: urease accessory protein UreF [Peptococcaceae bacterium]|nr:urease accessory protein UreF [Peptococcaceae bacterium]